MKVGGGRVILEGKKHLEIALGTTEKRNREDFFRSSSTLNTLSLLQQTRASSFLPRASSLPLFPPLSPPFDCDMRGLALQPRVAAASSSSAVRSTPVASSNLRTPIAAAAVLTTKSTHTTLKKTRPARASRSLSVRVSAMSVNGTCRGAHFLASSRDCSIIYENERLF